MKELSIEDKELLLTDLSARLPYNPIVYVDENLPRLKLGASTRVWEYIAVDKPCKPYLRSMSSMTEEEIKELLQVSNFNPDNEDINNGSICIIERGLIDIVDIANFISWLNKHHFDYRGLIEKGLALEAPTGMYK